MWNRFVFAVAAGMVLVGQQPVDAEAAVRFAVFSDPHYYDTDLGTEGGAFEAYLNQDRKLIRESEALTQALVQELIATHQEEGLDFVLVSGDLTKDGELRSHEEFAAYLAELEAAGIRVYVAPGNHDINNPHAVAYEGEKTVPVDEVSPEQFKTIYADYGFAEALSTDSASLSYTAEPVPGVVLLSLDSCKYDQNQQTGSPETSGAFSATTLAWITQQIEAAKASGKQVIAMQHHGLLEHYQGQSQAFPEYVIDDHAIVAKTLADAGLQLIFTGHYHANDITEQEWEDTGSHLYDVETGSLVTAPCPYRLVTLHGDNAAQIETQQITSIDYDTGGVDFQEYAQIYLLQGLDTIAQYSLQYEYGLDQDTRNILAPVVAGAFQAHYMGDEQPDEATLSAIEDFVGSEDATTQMLGKTLAALWTDLQPTDNRALLRLNPVIALSRVGTYASGAFNAGAAEIVAYDAKKARLFVSNAKINTLDVLDVSDPATPRLSFTIDLSPYGAGVNSVAVHGSVVAAAVESEPKQDPGKVVFFSTEGQFLNQVTVGALPDMLTFTPNGRKVVVANEGEPNDAYTNDPEGSVSIIDLSRGVRRAKVRTADFRCFNRLKAKMLAQGIRIFGPNATVAQDLEPEYIAISSDSAYAYVTLQENNALAKVDLRAGRVVAIMPLGVKDLGDWKNALDPSNKDDGIHFLTAENIYGLYLPDSIGMYRAQGKEYLVTANEGDSRDYEGFSEEERIKELSLDPAAFPEAETMQKKEYFGRLKVTTTLGDSDGDGDYDQLYAFGGRSFSIFLPGYRGLRKVFDSGKQLEELTAAALPFDFNSTNDEANSFDDRSDDKGQEPEGLALGTIDGRTYLFLGLERVGGIMVYDISSPQSPEFVQYINTRDFSAAIEGAGDLAPEGLIFIPAQKSPNKMNMLAVANEVSGTTTLYAISVSKRQSAGCGKTHHHTRKFARWGWH